MKFKQLLFLSALAVCSSQTAKYTVFDYPTPPPTSVPVIWPKTVEPPRLSNPITYELSNTSSYVSTINDWIGIGCDGKYFAIEVPDGRDTIIKMAPDAEPLKYGMWIVGGRNHHFVGIDIDVEIQPSCGVGEGNHRSPFDNVRNIKPRMPGHMAIRTQNSGTTFIEGVLIRMNGVEADCIVVRNRGISDADAVTERRVVVANSRCEGWESLDEGSEYGHIHGDSLHGDVIQNQGEPLGYLTFINSSFHGSGNWIVHHARGFNGTKFRLDRVNFGADPVYNNDTFYQGERYEPTGLAFAVHMDSLEFKDVYIDHPSGPTRTYGINGAFRYGDQISKDAQRQEVPFVVISEIKGGPPPGGDFAPQNRTGLSYSSPWAEDARYANVGY